MQPKIIRAIALCAIIASGASAAGQIVGNAGDGVLNAPYRGTITSMRELCADIPYGEVKVHSEPSVHSGVEITSSVQVWVEGEWDRSVLRLFEDVDASGDEVDLTGTSEFDPVTIPQPLDPFLRMSVKAIGTRTLEPQTFTVKFKYQLSGNWSTPTRTFTVAPMTGSFYDLPGESEAFHFGTRVLDVTAGAARLVVPIGRTAGAIGATFEDKDKQVGLSSMQTTDVVLPGAAESVYVQSLYQFRRLHSTYYKVGWGTPWAGHLVGYVNSGDTWGPTGMHYDSEMSAHMDGARLYYRIRPRSLSHDHPATQRLDYGGGSSVQTISDGATSANVITLHRSGGDVTRVTTSDGRGWDIDSEPVSGWITSITPDGGKGARDYVHNSAGRVTHVKNAAGQTMYEFVYADSIGGSPHVLLKERRYIDEEGALRDVVEHIEAGDYHLQRREYVSAGTYRLYDLYYDDVNGLKHRLRRIRAYRDENGSGPAYDTDFEHDINNPAGTMTVTKVTLPDGSTIQHEYDSNPDTLSVWFGFRSKTTRKDPWGTESLVTFDLDYDFFFNGSGANRRLYWQPRITHQRDGRGYEVVADYEEGYEDSNLDDLYGEFSNDLLRRTGPTITQGHSGTRIPETRYVYYDYFDPEPVRRVLKRIETDASASQHRDVKYEYDELLRLRFETRDPDGENIVTEYRYTDGQPTQDRVVVDPDGYYSETTYDNDGRVRFVRQYLTPGGMGTDYYQTEFLYDDDGWLFQESLDNKDQAGDPIVGETDPIVTEYTRDRLGRPTLSVVDPNGVAQESHIDHNWLGDIERQFDTSGRGVRRVFDGRGLTVEEIPLAAGQVEVPSLKQTLTYDANGRPRYVDQPTGAQRETAYDGFGRAWKRIRNPGPDGGATVTTELEYDDAGNITRQYISEDDGRAIIDLADTTHEYDEGGYCYESRQRLSAGVDSSGDPLMQYKFDWVGNVTETRSVGDATVTDRVITTFYDDANRVERTTDSEGGETIYVRDDRGNVEQLQVRLEGSSYALTDTQYDALSRAIRVTDPDDAAAQRHYRDRFYDSRGNLRRETAFTSSGAPRQTAIFKYDAAGRIEYQAVLADASRTELQSRAVDRVVDLEHDADGRLRFQRAYNSNSSTPLESETRYDDLGRVEFVYDPSEGFTQSVYAPDGRVDARVIGDWLGDGVRTIMFGYDGHDRVTSQTSVGDGNDPDLTTSFELDGLDRAVRVINPKGITTRTDYDLTGRCLAVVENEGGGALERSTTYDYNRLNQLITQTATNKASDGTPLASQTTHFRYDSLGRLLRTVYPDSVDDPENPACDDCVRMAYDDAGRMETRRDQRGLLTDYEYDDRGLLLTRTTGSDVDAYGYDALGRILSADRGDAQVDRDYTDLGDVDFETQTFDAGTPRTVDYTHDQAGNRTQVAYPNGIAVTLTHTPLDLVKTIDAGGQFDVEYQYYASGQTAGRASLEGRWPKARRVTTDDPAGDTVYEVGFEYDSHRRTTRHENLLEQAATPETIADYVYTHDLAGNPASQETSGMALFSGDDRMFAVDDLDRLVATTYAEATAVEESWLDVLGNRETHTNRAGEAFVYGAVNAANEYASVGGSALSYDAAGNLMVDEDGRQYSYDERSRLTEVQDATNAVLVRHTYDALGRRVLSEFSPDDPPNAYTIRYVYDGRRVIEERDGGDALVFYHVNGAQFIDERIATYGVGAGPRAGAFTYYLAGGNYSVTGYGNADGSLIERLDYSSTGDFSGGGGDPSVCQPCDANCDGEVDFGDINTFVDLMLGKPPCSWCAGDVNCDGFADFGDINDFVDCMIFGPSGACQRCQPCDADCDGEVSFGDINPFVDLMLGEDPCGWCAGDANCDGFADFGDINDFVDCMIFGPGSECVERIPLAGARAEVPPTGTFALHGRPIDVLADGKVLLYVRARFYDPQHGRWFQRDPAGFMGGLNLYESFASNPARYVDPQGRLIEELFNWWYVGKYASSAELEAALASKTPFENVRSSELIMFQNAGEAVIGLSAVGPLVGITVDPLDVARETGAEVAARHAAAVEATTQRLTAVSLAQLEAGATIEDATSTRLLTAVFAGDVIGVTPILEAGYDIDLSSNTALSDQQVGFLFFDGNERFRRGLQGSGQLILTFAPAARGPGSGAAVNAEAATIRARVLANIAESQTARAASNFRVFAIREGQVLATKVAPVEARSIAPYFPANRGFIGQAERQFLMPGQLIDRYGGTAYSRYFSPAGTPAAARALPPGTAGQPLRIFEVVKPFEVESGTVAPAFGQLGLGQQYVTPVRLEVLLKRGIIKEVPPVPLD